MSFPQVELERCGGQAMISIEACVRDVNTSSDKMSKQYCNIVKSNRKCNGFE